MSSKHDGSCSSCGVSGQPSWKMDDNDCGWHCACCGDLPGDPAGFSPALDKALLETKVSHIVEHLQTAEMLRVEDVAQRRLLISQVVERGGRTGYRDQSSLVTFIITFWEEVDVRDD